MTISAQQLEVLVAQRDPRVVDVLRREENLVVYDHARVDQTLLQAAFTQSPAEVPVTFPASLPGSAVIERSCKFSAHGYTSKGPGHPRPQERG